MQQRERDDSGSTERDKERGANRMRSLHEPGSGEKEGQDWHRRAQRLSRRCFGDGLR